MSLAHVRFVRLKDTPEIAEYRVECPDFNEHRDWVEVGKLVFRKQTKQYDFEPGQVWKENDILPPSFYALDEQERSNQLRTTFRNQGSGAWSITVYAHAIDRLRCQEFPEKFPLNYFLGGD
jgi:hypothetical protein